MVFRKIFTGLANLTKSPLEGATYERFQDGYKIILQDGREYVGDMMLWRNAKTGQRAEVFFESDLAEHLQAHLQRRAWEEKGQTLVDKAEDIKAQSNGNITVTAFNDGDYIVTLKNGRQYVGDYLVFRSFPDGFRPCVLEESDIDELVEQYKAQDKLGITQGIPGNE